MIEVDHVSGGYSDENILKDISFDVKNRELFGIIGPNGSGKTTLLKMISHILSVKTGEIKIKGKSISDYSSKEFAQLVAVLPQSTAYTFSYTVKETVSLGRYAHQRGLFHTSSEEDEKMIQKVMEQTGVARYENELIDNLSGGERQRVFLAQSLAQDPEVLLLDEPTNHLDLAYQKELLDVLKQWTKEKNLTVVSIFHDLNLAGLYCDRLLLLENGQMKKCGTTDDVLKRDRIENVYGAKISEHPHPLVAKPQMVLIPNLMEQQHFFQIKEDLLNISTDNITLQTDRPLRTMSSGVTGSGIGWHNTFVNRHVDKNYNVADHKKEMEAYLLDKGFDLNDTVSMMTAATLENGAHLFLEDTNLSALIVVTAGMDNAIDATLGKKRYTTVIPGTINIWVFVNGNLSEEAFIHLIMTATEAKVAAIRDLKIIDQATGTLATGTSTDSTLIAATQLGTFHPYGGTATSLGEMVGKGVYQCTSKAIKNWKKSSS